MGQILSSLFAETETKKPESPNHHHHLRGGQMYVQNNNLLARNTRNTETYFFDNEPHIRSNLLVRNTEMYVQNIRRNEVIWLKHYNNKQRILLVGEGDFSFSASLAVAFGLSADSASNITATSLDSLDFLARNYKNAIANIRKLTTRGATVMHHVDATTMSTQSSLGLIKFDRIVYNFPHSGFNREESRESSIKKHRKLVRGFMRNAKVMMKKDGEIHISHKTNGFHMHWNVNGLAFSEGLYTVREVDFRLSDYPGYETKYGFGGDKNFNCNPSKTYMWGNVSPSSLY